MQNDIIISIIIPIFNVEKYIERCIESLNVEIASVQFKGEVIFVDDGSTDNSVEIIKSKWSSDNKHWKMNIIKQANQGVAVARNTGLNYSKGEYISFLDSDDYILNGYLSCFYAEVYCSKNDVAIFGYQQLLPGERKVYKETNNYSEKCLYDISPWNKFFKRSYLIEKGISFVPTRLIFEDVGFNMQVFCQTEKILHLDKVLYCYDNTRTNSIMHTISEKNIEDMIAVIEDAINKIDMNSLSKDNKECLKYMLVWHGLSRHIPKFLLLYKYNIFKTIRTAANYYNELNKILVENSINNIFDNTCLINDINNYYYEKLGKNHIRKIQHFYSGRIDLFLMFIFKYILFRISKRKG